MITLTYDEIIRKDEPTVKPIPKDKPPAMVLKSERGKIKKQGRGSKAEREAKRRFGQPVAQQSKGSLGFSKHHKAFGKTNRNPTNNMRTSREINQSLDEAAHIKERKHQMQKWTGKVRDLR